jgi:hypothetical protein
MHVLVIIASAVKETLNTRPDLEHGNAGYFSDCSMKMMFIGKNNLHSFF